MNSIIIRIVKICSLSLMMLTMLSGSNSYAVTDKFNNFKELSLGKRFNEDYKISHTYSDSNIAVIAIHGGRIEKGTTELAHELASRGNFNFYSFQGIKRKDNSMLHITSTNFDEPKALAMVAKSEITLSLHGCRGKDEFTYVDGLDRELAEKIRLSLEDNGFTVLDAPKHLAGASKSNIVNRNARNKGVQLEISEALRVRFLQLNDDAFNRYVNAILEALSVAGM